MKKFFSIFLCLTISVYVLSACSSDKLIKIAGAPYRVNVVDGEYYLLIDKIEEISASGEQQESAGLKFKSIEEFTNTVSKYSFSNDQLIKIQSTFPKSEKGIKILNPEKIYIPDVPEEFQCSATYWLGETYSYCFEIPDVGFNYIEYGTQENYKDCFEYEYTNFFNRDLITLTKTEENEENDSVSYYYSTKSGEFKKVRYSFKVDGLSYTIDESYLLNILNPILDKNTSDHVPTDIKMYVENGKDFFCMVWISELSEKPTKDFLLQFKLKPYSK